jgi:hypothetical protein
MKKSLPYSLYFWLYQPVPNIKRKTTPITGIDSTVVPGNDFKYVNGGVV